ncbi:beta-Ig-H3/fasciclin [Streptomyces roseoverticillatus]|uniref:Beta-Ig-H3/fasciclin n=1 Tax=Streptomyces roseoverticillatus TaxID=66429 RepID=A0ABV3J1P3_9ACTN
MSTKSGTKIVRRAGVTVAGLALALTSTSALAASSGHGTPGAALAKGGTAPACIERNVVEIPDGGIKVYLRNLCGKTMRVKVIVKYWPDSGCKTMKANTGWLFRTVGGRYDRTVVC